jgi:hypothetical protein
MFGGQKSMARYEDIMDKFEGKFALTGRAPVWHPVGHALLPMACCLLMPNPDPFRTEL